jgi:hypothetical protein
LLNCVRNCTGLKSKRMSAGIRVLTVYRRTLFCIFSSSCSPLSYLSPFSLSLHSLLSPFSSFIFHSPVFLFSFPSFPSLSYSSAIFSLLKSAIYWEITPYRPLKVNGRFGGTYYFRLQWTCSPPASPWFLARLILWPYIQRRYVPPKRRFAFNGLRGVISQWIELFITTAVRTSNPTFSRPLPHFFFFSISFFLLPLFPFNSLLFGPPLLSAFLHI